MSFVERFDEILEEVTQHDASLIMEDVITNEPIDMLFVESADDSIVWNSKVPYSSHYILLRQKLKGLIKLHRELNTFTPSNPFKYSGDDWLDRCREYSYMSPEEFYKARGGTSWEYAQCQYVRLKDMGYNAINFYIEINDSTLNHTFTIVKERNKYIYLESYLDACRGIYVSDHIADIFTLVTSKLSEYLKKRIEYKIHIYAGYDNYECDYFVFKEHMESQKIVAKGNTSYTDKKVPNVQILESVEEDEMLTFEAAIEHSFYLKEVVEKNIFDTLDIPEKKKKFKRIQDEYINRNMDKLSTAGPQYLIVFGDNDQKAYYDLFGIRKEEIIAAMKKVTSSSGSGSEFKFLTQNPILVVLYFCIRYFTINKDQSSLNCSLSIYALAIYWSIFTKYFKHGVIGPVMEYTIDNLTEKFMIKKAGNIFNTLNMSIRQSYEFHKKRFFEGGDDDITAFAQRIRNDQNSLIKKIANEYMKNYKDGNAVVTRNDNYDSDKPILDDVENASTIIQNQVSKVTLPIISDGVDLVLAEVAAKLAEISVSDCREYLIKILIQKNLERLEDLIEGLLFMFIYTNKRTVRDINSPLFLVWGESLFKKTNSKDPNLAKVNRILEEWAIESGIYARYNRPGTRINYKKGILFYIILSIQKNS